jgi:hypothetical protein
MMEVSRKRPTADTNLLRNKDIAILVPANLTLLLVTLRNPGKDSLNQGVKL